MAAWRSLVALGLVGAQIRATETHEAESLDCLMWYGDGCASATDEDLCLSSRDGRPWSRWMGVAIYGQPCVWCGGEKCSNTSSSLCTTRSAVEEVLQNSSKFKVASCAKGSVGLPLSELPTPPAVLDGTFKPAHTGGQVGEDQACRGSSITDEKRANNNYYWTYSANSLEQCEALCLAREQCTGIEYHADSSYCEVWWKKIGWTRSEKGYQCFTVLFANASRPAGNPERQCLRWEQSENGCEGITDRNTCLRSRDGRASLRYLGINIHGEPCAWCEGGNCTAEFGNQTRCQPLAWLQEGPQKHVFKNKISEDNITYASCENGFVRAGGSRLAGRSAAVATQAAKPEPNVTTEASASCDGEVYLHLTKLSAAAKLGDKSIRVREGTSLMGGQDVVISEVRGENLDEDSDMDLVLNMLATKGSPVTTNRVVALAPVTNVSGQSPEPDSSVEVELADPLDAEFPKGAYVASHACKAMAVTSLRLPVMVGETELEVASSEGFAAGDSIKICGAGNSETKTIIGFGSQILSEPLEHSYPAGASVTKLPPEDVGDMPALGAQSAGFPANVPWWLWAILALLIVGCGAAVLSVVLNFQSKGKSARNATKRRRRSIDELDEDHDEETTPMLEKVQEEPMVPVRDPKPVQYYEKPLTGDPRLMPRTLTLPPLQVVTPYPNVMLPAPVVATGQIAAPPQTPTYLAVRPVQPMQPVQSAQPQPMQPMQPVIQMTAVGARPPESPLYEPIAYQPMAESLAYQPMA